MPKRVGCSYISAKKEIYSTEIVHQKRRKFKTLGKIIEENFGEQEGKKKFLNSV